MIPRTKTHVSAIIAALTLALTLLPQLAFGDPSQQSGADEPAVSQGEADWQDEASESPGSAGPSSSQSPGSESEDADEPDGFDQTLVDLIIEVVEEHPGATIEQIAEILDIPTEGPLGLVHEDGLYSVTVTFASSPTESQIASAGQVAEVRRVLDVAPVIMAYVSPTYLKDLVLVPGVIAVEINVHPESAVWDEEPSEEEKEEMLRQIEELQSAPENGNLRSLSQPCRTIPAVANDPLKVTQVHNTWGLDGTGVKVGVVSVSYDMVASTASDAAGDVAAGLLPGPGNPCGYTQPVQVLQDGKAPSVNWNDEGRAMAQIVHGIAPGATLLVTDVGRSPEETAQNIKDLADAGANIIVDDIYWSTELNFQKDLLSQQIDAVKADGVVYFSATGNDNVRQNVGSVIYTVGRHESNTFTPTACPSWVVPPAGTTSYDCLDFSPHNTGVPYGTYSTSASEVSQIMQWGESTNGTKTKLALQIYGTDSSGAECLGASGVKHATRPFMRTTWTETSSDSCKKRGQARLVVIRDKSSSGYGAPPVMISFFNGKPTARQFYATEGNNTLRGSQVGHNGNGSAASVAAASWTSPTTIRNYSSLGSNTQMFGPLRGVQVAPALNPQVTPGVPAVMGLDAISNSFFGSSVGGVYSFTGTSASAPTAAGVAALAFEFQPTRTHDELLAAMSSTAQAVANPYAASGATDANVFGGGLINAYAFINQLQSTPAAFTKVPTPVITGTPKAGQKLTATGATAGSFTPTAKSVTYQWKRNGTVIPGVTGATYTPTSTDVGKTITVTATATRPGYITVTKTSAAVQVIAANPRVTRLSGSDRYGTNRAVNAATAATGKPVFVASGSAFPDALSAGPAVRRVGGSLFLTPASALPPATLDEIADLRPSEVYIVGGTGAVSATVESQLRSATGRLPIRVSGKDRYLTSQAVFDRFFPALQPAVFVATGGDFPDALSGSAAGGALNVPVFLVNGKSASAPYAAQYLKGKGVTNVRIIGGAGAVSEGVAASIRSQGISVGRLSGADRYSTNMAVNQHVTQQSGTTPLQAVWVATGRNFPDALSAGVPAGTKSGRLVLSNGSCLPSAVVNQWIRSATSQVTAVNLVGGEGVLSNGVFQLLPCG